MFGLFGSFAHLLPIVIHSNAVEMLQACRDCCAPYWITVHAAA